MEQTRKGLKAMLGLQTNKKKSTEIVTTVT